MKNLVVLAVLLLSASATAHGQCTLTLSDEGVVRLRSGEQRKLTWNEVPGASSYLLQEVVEGLNEPSGPDFTFGGAYTESRDYEGRAMTSFDVKHEVLWKMRFRTIVTALNRENASFQPCSDSVLYVVEADTALASIAATRYIPLAGKTPGANGANFSTSLILSGTGHKGNPEDPNVANIYQGRIWFRPVGTTASSTDPSIPYALDGDQTVVIADVMAQLGASGIGTLEIVPRIGFPPPLVDAIVENRLPDGHAMGSRVQAPLGRSLLYARQGVSAPIRNTVDARVSLGVRSLGGYGMVSFALYHTDGTLAEVRHEFVRADSTTLYPISQLFPQIAAGDRVVAGFAPFDLMGAGGQVFGGGAQGTLLFLTETGNVFNNPSVIHLEPSEDMRYANGFDPFLVY